MVGLCDVDQKRIGPGAQGPSECEDLDRLRKMLEEQKEIDAVMVCTTDHIHYPATMLAMKLGKHVSTEKPMAAQRVGGTQLGRWPGSPSSPRSTTMRGIRRTGCGWPVEWIKSGAVGTVREVHIFTDRPIWPQGVKTRPASAPVPEGLDWDLWLGPAPYRDYHPGLHPFSWRGYWDFGTGALGDMGCHFWDSTVWALDLDQPTTIEAEQEGNSAETGPNWATIRYQFPAKGDRPPVKVTWWEGRRQTPTPL